MVIHRPVQAAFGQLSRGCLIARQSHVRSYSSSSSVLPRVVSPSIWSSIIPKAFRQPRTSTLPSQKKERSKEWNPATFFIVMSLLVGSNAIQFISLRQQKLNYSRKTEAKIALLKEVIERVQKGEEVDVERVLGTDDPESEKEWEDVVKEISSDNDIWETKRKKQAERAQRRLEQRLAADKPKIESVNADEVASSATEPRRPGFY